MSTETDLVTKWGRERHRAWTADVAGVGFLEERDPGDYVGRHRKPYCVQCGKNQPWPYHTVRYCSDQCKADAADGVLPFEGDRQYE